MRFQICGLLTCLALAILSPAASATIADWGITGGYNSDTLVAPGLTNEAINSTYLATANQADVSGGHLFYRMEDGVGASGLVGPNYGGQQFDAEYLGAIISGTSLRIGLVMGHRIPGTGAFSNVFEPGDIRITTTSGQVYGIEVGAGGGLGSLGATYRIDGNGYATGVRYSNGTTAGYSPFPAVFLAQQTAGSIWATGENDWLHGIAPPVGGLDTQFQMLAGDLGDLVGNATDYSYTNLGTNHALIEVSLNWTLLGSIQSIAWTPGCNNDVLGIELPVGTFRIPPSPSVPEPTSVLGWAFVFGGMGLSLVWRRRRV